MVTIFFAHPWHGSFNYAILETTIEKDKKSKKDKAKTKRDKFLLTVARAI